MPSASGACSGRRNSPRESEYAAIEARGREIVNAAFILLDKALADKDWVVGDPSLADPALFYPSYWAEARLNIELPNNSPKTLQAHNGGL